LEVEPAEKKKVTIESNSEDGDVGIDAFDARN